MEDRQLLRRHESVPELRRHAERIGAEFFAGFMAVEKIDRPACAFFGSARLHEGSAPAAISSRARASTTRAASTARGSPTWRASSSTDGRSRSSTPKRYCASAVFGSCGLLALNRA